MICEVGRYLDNTQAQHRASVQGHSGSVVCRQAAEQLTVWFSKWRTEAAFGEVADTSDLP